MNKVCRYFFFQKAEIVRTSKLHLALTFKNVTQGKDRGEYLETAGSKSVLKTQKGDSVSFIYSVFIPLFSPIMGTKSGLHKSPLFYPLNNLMR